MRDAYAIDRSLPSSNFYDNTALNPHGDASQANSNSLLLS